MKVCPKGHEYYYTKSCLNCVYETKQQIKELERYNTITNLLRDIQEQKDFLLRYSKNWNFDYGYLVANDVVLSNMYKLVEKSI